MASGSNFHTNINPHNSPVTIDLIESTPLYCKIEVSQKMGPLKINIDFVTKPTTATTGIPNNQGDFKLYVSDKALEPNETNSIHVYHNT